MKESQGEVTGETVLCILAEGVPEHEKTVDDFMKFCEQYLCNGACIEEECAAAKCVALTAIAAVCNGEQ